MCVCVLTTGLSWRRARRVCARVSPYAHSRRPPDETRERDGAARCVRRGARVRFGVSEFSCYFARFSRRPSLSPSSSSPKKNRKDIGVCNASAKDEGGAKKKKASPPSPSPLPPPPARRGAPPFSDPKKKRSKSTLRKAKKQPCAKNKSQHRPRRRSISFAEVVRVYIIPVTA